MSGKEESTTTENAAKSTETENPAEKDDYLAGATIEDGEDDTIITDDDKGTEDQTQDTDGKDDGSGVKTIPQEKFDKRVNKLTFEKNEERRKREEAERAAAEAKAEIERIKGEKKVVIPPMPDVVDPEYDRKIAERENAIREDAAQKAREEAAKAAQQTTFAEQQRKANEALQANIDRMFETGKELGYTREDMLEADSKVAQFLTDPAVANFMLGREDSALLVKYLSAVPQQLDKLSRMNSVDAAVFIATDVAPEAAKLKPGQSKAPDPIKIPGGKAGGEKQSPFLEGVTFE